MIMELFLKAYKALHGASDVPEISVEELKDVLDKKEPLLLLDVREPSESAICSIPGARLIPMAQIADKVGELDKEKPIAVHCHHGGRSARVVQYLRKSGFKHVVNVAGGIDDWAEKIDPTMKRY